MTREEAVLDAALTVQLWKRQGKQSGISVRIARVLGCHKGWAAIEREIVRRLMRAGDRP
jgi:hypothetical protein